MKKVIILLLFTACRPSAKIPNYKNVNGQLIIWKYSKPGESKKDILSNGDTLISTGDTVYIKSKQQ